MKFLAVENVHAMPGGLTVTVADLECTQSRGMGCALNCLKSDSEGPFMKRHKMSGIVL